MCVSYCVYFYVLFLHKKSSPNLTFTVYYVWIILTEVSNFIFPCDNGADERVQSALC